MSSVIIHLDRNINDDVSDFEYLFRLFNQHRDHQDKHIRFQFTGCEFLRPNAVAFLGGMTRWLRHKNNDLVYDLEGLPDNVRMNLEQNGFLHTLGIGSSPWDGNSVPYREDHTYRSDFTDYLKERWLGKGWLSVSEDLKRYIAGSMVEIYDNGCNHARSPIGTFTCGQHFPKLKELKLAFVDFGVGIPFNVREYLKTPFITSRDALQWAFTPGHTTRDKLDNLARGNGLKLLTDFMDANNGKMEVYSDTGFARVGRGTPVFQEREVQFHGTFVQVSLKCDSRHYTLPSEDDFDSQEDLF